MAATFEIVELLATNATVIEHEFATGDDRGGIATSDTHVFYTGDEGTGRFDLNDLSAGTNLGQRFDALVGNLLDDTVYSLSADGVIPFPGGSGTITHLLEHNSDGSLSGNSIALSNSIIVESGSTGVFAGFDRIVLTNSTNAFEIDLTPGNVGTVTDLGAMSVPSHQGTENWAYWGVTEHFGGDDYITYVQNSTTISRTRVSDGMTQTVASFPNGLSDMASFTISLSLDRWYFHFEGTANTFRSGHESIGFADATFTTIININRVQPDPRTEPVVSIEVQFDQAIDSMTFDFADLTLTRNGGANLIDETVMVTDLGGNLFRIDNLGPLTTLDGTYRLTVDGTNINTQGGAPLGSRDGERWVIDSQFPILDPVAPFGSLIYSNSITRNLAVPLDVQQLEITVEAGQTMTIEVVPVSGLQPSVALSETSGPGLVASAVAAAPGETLILRTIPVSSTTTYVVTVGSLEETMGNFDLTITLNAALEIEQLGASDNDTIATAQDVAESFVPLGNVAADRGAVIGSVGDVIYTTQRNDNLLRRLGGDGSTLSSIPITIDGVAITQGRGLAVDPTTGVLYGIVEHGDSSDADLVTIDPETGAATVVGLIDTNDRKFAELAFDADGVLYAVTGGRDNETSTLFQIDKSNASVVAALHTFSTQGAGGLAYNVDDGLFYRFQRESFESIDVSTPTPTVTSIPLSGEFPNVAQAMTWLEGDEFLLYSGGGGSALLYKIDTAGNSAVFASLDHNNIPHGMARVSDSELDLFAFQLSAGETATLAMTGSNTVLELLDSSGAVIETAVPSRDLSQVISGFTAPTTDTYFARLTADVESEYALVVTRNAAFDTEGNDRFDSAQPITSVNAVLGELSDVLLGADDGSEHLLRINTRTGEGTIIRSGVGASRGYTDLAFNPVTELLYASQGEGGSALYIVNPLTGDETLIGSPGRGIQAMAWSPEGSTLFAFEQGTFGTIDVMTGTFTAINNPGLNNIGGIAFQPGTGTLFAVESESSGLYTIDPLTGVATFVANPGIRFNSLEFLADGTLLAGGARNNGSLFELDPVTGVATFIGSTLVSDNRNLTALESIEERGDFYSFPIVNGQRIVLRTSTPAGGDGEFVNNLDPILTLFDPEGVEVATDDNGLDGRNALLIHTASESGTYFVRVSSANTTTGEYVLTLPRLDFGDAPDPLDGTPGRYPTFLENNGAAHKRNTDGPILGEVVDTEFDGTPSSNADGDDNLSVDDEDGVTFAALMRTSLVEDRSGNVTVTVSNVDEMAGAKLDAWIDFNQDGDWDDDGEQIADDLAVDNGENELPFTIAAGTHAGTTFSRFRLSTSGGLGPIGLAEDGEVEDHAVTFLPELVEVVVDEDGNLAITDFGGASNNITIKKRGSEFVISSKTNDLTADGLTPTNEVRIPVGDVTGGILADLSNGDDRLDFSTLSLDTTVRGGAGNDTILSGSGHDNLMGEGGHDSLSGGSRQDRLDGGEGNDTIRGGSGSDTLTGGTGTDSISGDGGSDVLEEFANVPIVTLRSSSVLGLGSTPVEQEKFSGINAVRIIAGDSNNFVDASACGLHVTLIGGAGDDTLLGSRTSDVLIGDDGEDVLNGNAGSDTLLGGESDDQLFGGSGNDVLDGEEGDDALNGQTGNDAIRGGDGDDTATGESGNDTLLGSEGDDSLSGGSSKDRILGEAGADTIDGGTSTDRLCGGGNGVETEEGDIIVGSASEIYAALTFDFDALLDDLEL